MSDFRHHDVFEKFERVRSTGTGRHVLDFVGARFDQDMRAGFEKYATRADHAVTPSLPPFNEHYYDWIMLLSAIDDAKDGFRMAELGAGFGLWTVRAWHAARQRFAPEDIHLLAIEADQIHYNWIWQALEENGVPASAVEVILGAAVSSSRMLRFPKLTDPSSDYGASIYARTEEFVDVQGYSVAELLERFDRPVDFLHVDIQGAEYEALGSAMAALKKRCKRILIGTHSSDAQHDALHVSFVEDGWRPVLVAPRKSQADIGYGPIPTGDGVLAYENPDLL